MAFTPARSGFNFQAPQGAALPLRQDANIPGGLEQLFQNYMAMKQGQRVDAATANGQQMQDLELRAKYGGVNPLTDLNAEQRRQGLAGPTIIPAQPGRPEVAPGPDPYSFMSGLQSQDPMTAMRGLTAQTPGQDAVPATPEQTQYHENPVIAALQKHVQTQKESEAASLAATKAGTLEKTAHATKDLADASLADRKPFDVQMSEKANQFNTKRFTQLGDALDPSKARAGAFGTSKQVYDRAERLQTLAGAYKDNNLDSRQVEELAIGLNSMLSGSNVGAASQVEKLVPKSIMGDKQKLMEWLSNDPKGTNQQEFVKRMLGSIDREKSTASDQIKRTQFERIGRYGDLEKADPDEFANVLQSANVDPKEYQDWKKGGYKKQTAVQGAEGGAGHSDIALTGSKAARLAELRAKAVKK